MPDLSTRIRTIVPEAGDGWEVHNRAVEMLAAGKPVTMLSIGDHDIPTSAPIREAMKSGIDAGHLGYSYPPGIPPLRQAVAARAAARTGVPTRASNVIITSGGQGALFAAMMAALDPGDSCIVLDPYYATFCVTIRAASGEPIIVPTRPEDGFQPDPVAIETALTPRTRALLINTPNNPSGAIYTPERLQALAELCIRRDLWLIADELYETQVHDGVHLSPRSLPGMAERTFSIGSMSKGFAMTGSRVGWVIAPEAAIAGVADLALATTYGLPPFIQDAALYGLTECATEEAEVATRYHRRRDIALATLGNGEVLGVVPPEGGMYVMLDVRRTGLDGVGFAHRLLQEEEIAVMPGESFGDAAAGHVRIALTVPDETLDDAMRRIVALAERLASGG